MAQTAIDGRFREELAAVAAQAACELVDVEFRGGTLRVILDRPDGGITLGDCETVSKELSALLDVLEFGRDRYTLEVSSPGLDRRLYGPRDYQRFCGRMVRVTWVDRSPDPARAPVRRTIIGRLEEYRPPGSAGRCDRAEITVCESVSGPANKHHIALDDVEQARLEIEL
jgi:ribosome maturation factor RimP